MQLETLYNEQIDALVNHDYEKFCKLIKYNHSSRQITSHRKAWNWTADYATSLFANLPGYYSCASEVEHESRYYDDDVICEVLANAPISLPDLHTVSEYTFTLEELEEFKRRQLVARNCV